MEAANPEVIGATKVVKLDSLDLYGVKVFPTTVVAKPSLLETT